MRDRRRRRSAAGYLVNPASADVPPACAATLDIGGSYAIVEPMSGNIRPVVTDGIGDTLVSRDGRVLGYTDSKGDVVFVDLQTGDERARVPSSTFPQRDDWLRAISSDGRLALYGDRPQVVVDTTTGRFIDALHGGEGENYGQAFALAGDVAYTSGRDAVLRAWDASTGAQSFALPGVDGGSVLTTVNGPTLVVSYDPGTVTVADPRPRGEAAELDLPRILQCQRAHGVRRHGHRPGRLRSGRSSVRGDRHADRPGRGAARRSSRRARRT